jgi:hypothetical protein
MPDLQGRSERATHATNTDRSNTMTDYEDAIRRRATLRNAFVALHAAANDVDAHLDWRTFGFDSFLAFIDQESIITKDLASRAEKWNLG